MLLSFVFLTCFFQILSIFFPVSDTIYFESIFCKDIIPMVNGLSIICFLISFLLQSNVFSIKHFNKNYTGLFISYLFIFYKFFDYPILYCLPCAYYCYSQYKNSYKFQITDYLFIAITILLYFNNILSYQVKYIFLFITLVTSLFYNDQVENYHSPLIISGVLMSAIKFKVNPLVLLITLFNFAGTSLQRSISNSFLYMFIKNIVIILFIIFNQYNQLSWITNDYSFLYYIDTLKTISCCLLSVPIIVLVTTLMIKHPHKMIFSACLFQICVSIFLYNA